MAFRTKPIALTRVPMAIPRALDIFDVDGVPLIEVRIEGVKHEKDDINRGTEV